ncbi:hypothetical protein GCK72_011420 [Caenorhabditis remanei]|uniref:DUF38 domain-containing protein n=1 Tax=Caenorhabditis remanei TaxID=31234 RepID=A0A6A5H8N3_CAERE|nr:hypothetical protein GCK72_011420 [Caenorhabditis remanei]KAF1763154.1 hypothetical protein GCK72_011420 [Caenorhabditis remanei]
MTGEEVMDLDKVTELFKEFDNKLRPKGEQPKVTLAQILNVPDFVEKYLDIDSRLRLRKTCKTIRKILDEKPLHIDRLNYKCNGKFIEISTDGGFRVFYEIIEIGVKVTNGNKKKLIRKRFKKKQIKIIQRDLLSILGNGKLRIDSFRIENSEISGLYDEKPPIGMRVLQNTVNRLTSKLNVKKMVYLVYVVDKALVEMVKVMNPEHFQSLQFSFERYLYNCTLDWKDLYNLEQWKQLKSLNIFYPFLAVSDIVNSYTHFENAHLKIRSFYDFFDENSIWDKFMQIKKVSYFPQLSHTHLASTRVL